MANVISIRIDADGKAAIVETQRTASEMDKSYKTTAANLEQLIKRTKVEQVNAEVERILAAEKASAARIVIAQKEAAAQEALFNKLRGDAVRQETQRILAAEQASRKIKEIRAAEVAAANLYVSQNPGAVSDRFQSAYNTLGIKSSLNIEAEKARIVAAFEQIKNSGTASAKDITRAHQAMKAELSGLESPLNTLKSGFAALGPAAAVAMAVFVAREMVDQLHQAGMAAERLRNSFEAAAGSISKGASEQAYARAEAQRLGLDLLSTSQAYLKLTASAKGTALEGEKTRDIFSSVAGAGRALGLSSEEMNGALMAISQMMSKGTVQAEELRGQLGERLPGAFNIAARSMGLTTAQLNKMLENGEVISDEFLPKFAAELQRTFPPGEKAMQGMTAETARLKTAWFELKTTVMTNGGESMFTDAIRGMKSLVVEADTFYARMTGAMALLKGFAKNPMDPNLGGAPPKTNYAPLNQYDQYLANPDFSVIGPTGGTSGMLGAYDAIFAPSRPIKNPSEADVKAADKAAIAAEKARTAAERKARIHYSSENDLLLKNIKLYQEMMVAQEKAFFELSGEIDRTTETESRVFSLLNSQNGDLSTNRYDVTPLSQYRLLDNTPHSIPQFDPVAESEREKEELLKMEQEFQKQMFDVKADAAASALGLMKSAFADSREAQIAVMIAEKALAIARILQNTEVAASAAIAASASIPVGGAAIGAANAAAIRTQGYLSMGMVAASGVLEGMQIAGRRADGGSVRAGSSYLVGERGIEVLTMGASDGYITPNHALGGINNVTINQHFSITGVAADLTENMKLIAKQAGNETRASILNSMNRGGTFALASGRRA